MGLIHVRHGDKNWSKMFCGIIPNLVHDLKVKVKDLEVLCKSFVLFFLQFPFFAKPSMDFIYVRHDDGTLSEILRSAIPIPVHGLQVKVTEFEFLC